MNALAAAVCELMGWADGDSLRARLARAAPEVAAELGLPPAPWTDDARFVRQVAERCAVNETYFFRHAEQLEACCAELLRTFPGRPLAVWSAACSTGEETWSLAMQLLGAGAAPERLTVLGTDVCELALVQARGGRYAEWSFRGVPAPVRERCFVKSDDDSARERLTVAERFRPPVQFLSHNLLSPPPLREAHLIACRNALIYLRPDAARRALRHLESVLAPGGLLLLGTAEQHLAGGLGLEPLVLGNVLVLRKPLAAPADPPRPVAPVLPAPAPARPAPLPQPSLPRVLESEAPIEAAWRALRAGLEGEARALAEVAAAAQLAEAHLVLATLDEAAGEQLLALEHLRRALYLDPRLILAHVSQAALYGRLGRERDAGRARSNALRHLSALDPETILRALTPVSVRELREVLEAA